MKNLQTGILKIIASLSLIFITISSNAQTEKFLKADSLFKAKQFTQSLELYQSFFNEKKYSPAMLLKMAYINEGLGKTGLTLYYLKLYHLATDDEQALKKAEEIATKNRLTGFETNDASRLQHWIYKNSLFIQYTLVIGLFATAAIIFAMRKHERRPWGALVALVIISGALSYFNNIHSSSSVIAAQEKTYLMNGPSAGAKVEAIIYEGSLMQSLGQEDVWLKVKWQDKEVYVKKNTVLEVSI